MFRARAASPLAGHAMAALLLIAASVAGPCAAADFDAEKHFKGKTIKLVVDFKPGGGTDVQARYFAANWGKFIPGNPKMAVTNLFPNPSGRNYTWRSAPDGLTLSFVASPGVGDELVEPTAEFQSGKFTQIGSHAQRDVVFLVRGTVPYKSLQEAKGGKTPLTLAEPVGSADDLSGKLLAIGMLAMWLDVPLRIAPVARSGTADALLMLERGDINSWMADSQWFALTKLRAGWFKSGYIKPLAEMGHPDSPLPANSEIAMSLPNAITWLNDEQKEVWKGIFLPEVIHGKAIIGPPNMPGEIAKALRDTYATAVSDPAFGEGLEKIQGQPAFLMRGENLQDLVADATKSFKEQLPRYNEIRQQVYDRLSR
jgi:tripartite-type tricarboxylate transporter receptor subunit TctC